MSTSFSNDSIIWTSSSGSRSSLADLNFPEMGGAGCSFGLFIPRLILAQIFDFPLAENFGTSERKLRPGEVLMTPWKNNWSFVSSKFPPLRRPETVPTQINARHMDNTSQYCARTSRMPKKPLRRTRPSSQTWSFLHGPSSQSPPKTPEFAGFSQVPRQGTVLLLLQRCKSRLGGFQFFRQASALLLFG